MNIKSIGQIVSDAFPVLGDLRAAAVASRDAMLRVKEHWPDASEFVDAQVARYDEQIAKLDAVVDPNVLADAGIAALRELKNLPHVGLTGQSHPGTATGG